MKPTNQTAQDDVSYQIYELYRGKSTDWPLLNKLWAEFERLESLILAGEQ